MVISLGRNRFSNRDWKQGSESDISGDEVSASTESGKEDKKTDGVRPSKSRSHFKKTEKDERNKVRKSEVGESKGSFQNLTAPRFDRKSEFLGNSREGFAPSGQPSRRGRGSVRMRGGLSRRMDGYGPPPSKTLFSHQEDKKNHSTEKGNEVMADEKGNAEDDKGKQKQLSGTNVNSVGVKSSIGRGKTSQMPPRMQKKSEMEQR